MLRKIAVFGLLLVVFMSGVASVAAQESAQPGSGVVFNSPDAFAGYTLFAPMSSTTTYLIDNNGQVIHTWESDYRPGNSVYLLENGNLLHTGSIQSSTFNAGGSGGIVQEFTWDGDLVWEFEYTRPMVYLHHDIEPLPNGNVLMIAWEYKSAEEVLAAGRDPDLLPSGQQQGPGQPSTNSGDQGLWVDHIIEVDPTSGTIVWEWHIWDHLVQDMNASLPNYGVVADNPGKIDLNYTQRNLQNDWNHVNAVDYNPALDQIVISVHNFNEIWIIDHALTTAEAAGPAGDLLYRWGNPAAYGDTGTQQLFAQHDAQWIEPGLPGEGHILIFNNGDQRTRPYSSVEEIATPIDESGTYATITGSDTPVWTYTGDFYAQNISGAQRLPNGNTLICDGPHGTFIEVTAAGDMVWEYVNPVTAQRQGNTANEVFRAERYALDFAAFAGRDVSPGAVLASTVTAQAGQSAQSAQNAQPGGASGPNGSQPGNANAPAGNQPGNPPQEAIDACSGLVAGTTCQFTGPRGNPVSGTCRQSPANQLVCAPQGNR